jgi:beta-N-acetylhexosaminidase
MKLNKSIFSVIILTFILTNTYAFTSLPPCKNQLSSKVCAKIGQMLIIGFGGLKQEKGVITWEDPNGINFNEKSLIAKHMRELNIGGVIIFEKPYRNEVTKTFIRDRNVHNPEQLTLLTDKLKAYSTLIQKKNHLSVLPLLITVDQEGGMVNRLPTDRGFNFETVIPQALGAEEERILSIKQPKKNALVKTYLYASHMANQLYKLHFNVNFFPTLDININPLNPIIGGKGRSFSANPHIVTDQGWEFVKAFHKNGIISSLKHFPGHGSSSLDTHEGMVDVTDSYQKEKELLPFRLLIKYGYEDLIMTTHVINGQIDKTQCKGGPKDDHTTWCPATMSHVTLTKLLRQQLGFKGVIISDDMSMGAIANEYPLEVSLEKSINAGVDMFIISNNDADHTEEIVNTIAKLVKEGKINISRIDDAYTHIVKIKRRIQ